MDGEEFVEPLVPALKGKTNISEGTMYTFLDNVIKVLYNELIVPLMNSDLKSTIQKFCGIVYVDNGDGTSTEDRSNLNEYANLLNVDYVIPTYEFTSEPFIAQGNNIIKSILDQLVKPEVIVWQAGGKEAFKPNLVRIAKELLENAGDDLFADYVELATPEELEAMTDVELVVYAVRAIINSSAYGMYIPETDTIREFAFIALKQILATDVPQLDFSNLDPNSTDSLVIMGINYAIHAVSSEIDMGLEFVDSMEGVDAQLKKAADYAVDNYGGLLNGITFKEGASGWETIDTVIFSIIPENWLPESANGSLKNFIFTLVNTIADLEIEELFSLFEYRADSELQKTPKQVIINLVSRVINIIFPGAFKSATKIDDLVTNQALAGTVRAIFNALWNYRANLVAAILPTLCGILDLTNDQEFEFPELTWDPTDANVDGNSIRTAGSIAIKLMVRNGSTGINTGYTDANGVFHQDKLYTYDIKSVTTNVSGMNVSYPNTIAGGQTVEMAFTGAVKASTPFVVTMTYDVLTEDGSPLTEEPITETLYSYIAYNEAPDEETKLTSTTVGNFSIIDGPRYLYANGMGDLEDITITVQNANAAEATAVPHYTQTNTAANRLLGAASATDVYLQLLTEGTKIMPKVEDTAGIANMKMFETTEAYNELTGEEKEAAWDSIIEFGTVVNTKTGAITRYPRIQLTLGAKINGSTTVQNTGVLVFCYKDFGLPGMLEDEMGKHRQQSAYGTAQSTVFAGKTVWEAYSAAMEAASKAVYSCFRNGTFANANGGKASLYEPAYNNLKAAIEELDAQVLSAGVASSEALIEKCYPSNPEDLPYYDPAYIHHGVSDYVAYTYYNFRDELRALEGMIDSATIPDEEGNVAVVNELDKAYKEHRFSLYFSRLLKAPSYNAHLQDELANPTRVIGDKADYSEESWTDYENALAFATATANEANANQTKIKTAYRELLEAEKRLVAPSEGGDIGGEDVAFAPIEGVEIVEGEDGIKFVTGIGNANDDYLPEDYFACDGCYVEATNNELDTFSTGATIAIKNIETDEVIDTFTVVVFGDITGDGVIDNNELSPALLIASASIVPDEMTTLASDLTLDGATDQSDLSNYLLIASASATVDSLNKEVVLG
jgi:hypothetical protein